MADFVELLKEFDVNNVFWLLIVSIVAITVIAGYMHVFMASGVENILMSKGDEVKKISVAYVIFLLFFSVLNYVFILDKTSLIPCLIILGVVLVLKLILEIIKKASRLKKEFPKCEEKLMLYSLISFFPLVTYVVQEISDINQLSSAILCALVETVIVGFLFLNFGERVSSTYVQIQGRKWFVFKRIDENYLLCGDNKQLSLSTEILLLALDDIVDEGVKLVKENK